MVDLKILLLLLFIAFIPSFGFDHQDSGSSDKPIGFSGFETGFGPYKKDRTQIAQELMNMISDAARNYDYDTFCELVLIRPTLETKLWFQFYDPPTIDYVSPKWRTTFNATGAVRDTERAWFEIVETQYPPFVAIISQCEELLTGCKPLDTWEPSVLHPDEAAEVCPTNNN